MLTRISGAVIALVLAGTLTGCGIDTGANPGVAARVGDVIVSNRDVNQTSVNLCGAVEPQLQGQVVPMGYVRSAVVTNLLVREVADGIAEEYGVSAGDTYEEVAAAAEEQVADLDEDEIDAYVLMNGTNQYVNDILLAAAEKSLAVEGVSADQDPQLVQQRAGEIMAAWPVEQGVEFDPRYGVAFVDGQFASVDTSISAPVSEVAQRASSEDTSWAAELPAGLRCG